MKRILPILLAVLIVLSFTACGSYKPPVLQDDEAETGKKPTQMDDDPTNDFTVTLNFNGAPYKPTVAIDVYWNDGYDIYVAPVDETGVARIDGLDGDYRVTLSAPPHGLAYDPNSYEATNFNRNIVLDLYDLNAVSGSGTELYGCYKLDTTGIYSVKINRPGELVYFEFAPQFNGTYTVESWASVADDEINPLATAYYGGSNYKHSPYEVLDEGAVGSFTRNFVHTIKIADEMISGGGSQTFTFALSAESKSGNYPVIYSFAIKRDGGFDLEHAVTKMMGVEADFSKFDFDAFRAMAGGKIVGAETLYRDPNGNEVPGTYVFEQDRYAVWKIEQGGDGMYHVYDKEKYPETNGYGPLLVAYISEPCRYLDSPFNMIESFGNRALTVNGGTENYKQFIEGWEALASAGYYCVNDCPCHTAKPNEGKPEDVNKACTPDCTNCRSTCTRCPAELMGQVGYAAYCNADGVAPVTQELADFFQKFAISQRYFADGDGWAETRGIYAFEDSQWLFACGYYE